MSAHESRDRPRGGSHRFVGILGEVLITLGVLALGYVGWQVALSDSIVGGQQQSAAESFAQDLGAGDSVQDPTTVLRTDPPPISAAPADRAGFAVMYVPRFGDFARVVGEGTSRFVLDSLDLGLAHYADSALPGDIGNVAIAGHRNGQGGPFTNLDELRVGDRMYLLTDQAWLVYEFRNSEYVEPTAVGVVAPVPQAVDQVATDRLLTLTTCNPEWSAAGRLVAYASFVGWAPSADGMPAELAAARGA